MIDIKGALKEMPTCAMGNYDPLSHKTISDLVYCVRHEVDLHQEGEDSDIKTKKQLSQCLSFIEKYDE